MTSGFLAAQSCPSGMISYWKLQEFSGPYDDFAGNHNAVTSGAPSQTTGVSGKGQLFNGSSSYLTVADHSEFDWTATQSFSIELWVKFTNVDETEVFIARDEQATNNLQWWIGHFAGEGNVTWYIEDFGGDAYTLKTPAAINNGQWRHVVVVRDGPADDNFIYIDGAQSILDNNVNITATLEAPTAAPINIGNMVTNNVPQYFFGGALDEIAIYNRVLTPGEISTHYNNAKNYQIGYCSGNDPEWLSTPGIKATVGQQYKYDADASGNPLPTYSLLANPSGMSINSTTGEITWTPSSATANGHVIVQATNGGTPITQEFSVYIAEAPDCRSNLIAYWNFNDLGSAPYYDNMESYELRGGSPSSTTGKIDGGLYFDGVNDSLNMHDDVLDPDNVFFDWDNIPSFSWEVWVKSSASTSEPVMVLIGRDQLDNATHYWLGIEASGIPTFYLRDYDSVFNSVSGSASILDDSWHHLVATYNATSNSMKLYVDAVLVDDVVQNFANFGGNANLNIGCLEKLDGGNRFWYEGQLDELAFYNTELSLSTVQSNYEAANAGDGACTFNYAPVITTTPDDEVDEDTDYTYTLRATDLDGDALTITAPVLPEWLDLAFTAGDTSAVLSGEPLNAHVGTHNVTLRVFDGSINVDQVFTIEVINVNDPPVISSLPGTLAMEDAFYYYKVVATDEDAGDELTITAPVLPAWLELVNDSLKGTPSQSDEGFHNVTIRVSDGQVNVDQPFMIEVRSENDAPEITSNAIEDADDYELYSYHYTAVDPDGDAIIYSTQVLPEWLTNNAATQTLEGTPQWDDADQNFDIVLIASDGFKADTQKFTIHVGNDNDAPEFTSSPVLTGKVGEQYMYNITVDDVDEDDELTITIEFGPDWLSLVSGNALTGTPLSGDEGDNAVILVVSDGQDETLQNFQIDIAPTALKEHQTDLVQLVYPNPVQQQVTFRLNRNTSSVRIMLYDITGNVQESVDSALSEVEIDMSSFPKGMYIYKVFYNNEVVTGKITKE